MHANSTLLVLLCLTQASLLLVPVEATFDDIIGSFVSLALGQRPNNENGTASQFKDRALEDKSKSKIYDNTTQEIIEFCGFKQRTYQVVSDDGYITQLINLINPLADRRKLKRPPVMLFQPGLTDPTLWIWADIGQHHPQRYPRVASKEHRPVASSNRSLAFMLANNGYDVWLVGTRGSNKQNLGHVTYRPKLLGDFLDGLFDAKKSSEETARELADTIKYFDYSYDELVDYEYPRQIEVVLRLTGSEKVSIVAYALVTPITFKLLSSKKPLAKRVHSYVALAPFLNMNGCNKLVKLVAKIAPKIPTPLGTLLLQLILSKPVREFARALPRYETYKTLLTFLFGPSAQYRTDLADPIVGHALLSTGFKELQHFFQLIKAGRLQKLDYGPSKNLRIYGSPSPPFYDLSRFAVQHWMIATGVNDVLGTTSSGDQYVRSIEVQPDMRLNIEGYNHVDFVAAYDNDVQINFPIMQFLEKFPMEADQQFKSGYSVLSVNGDDDQPNEDKDRDARDGGQHKVDISNQ